VGTAKAANVKEAAPQTCAIPGVALRPLWPNRDARGQLTELFRASWPESVAVCQWVLLQSCEGSLRGVHLHHRHSDYLTVLSGRLRLGLRDCRVPDGLAAMLELDAAQPLALRIPPGVAHGFLHLAPTQLLLGVDDYWDPLDELACRFDDPRLGLDWGLTDPLLSARDREAGDFDRLLADYAAARGRPA
jgi:dTDP-4-dehydrorhamnose 3,5-epimerase